MKLVLKTAPAVEPVTASEAKAHLNVTHSTDDTYIGTLITAARNQVENDTGLKLITQTWYGYQGWFTDELRFGTGPIQSVSSVKYLKSDGSSAETVSTDVYELDSAGDYPRVVLKYQQSWPTYTLKTVNGVVIEFVAGYGLAAAVPQALKHACLLLIGHWYVNREAVTTEKLVNPLAVPMAYESLIAPYKFWRLCN